MLFTIFWEDQCNQCNRCNQCNQGNQCNQCNRCNRCNQCNWLVERLQNQFQNDSATNGRPISSATSNVLLVFIKTRETWKRNTRMKKISCMMCYWSSAAESHCVIQSINHSLQKIHKISAVKFDIFTQRAIDWLWRGMKMLNSVNNEKNDLHWSEKACTRQSDSEFGTSRSWCTLRKIPRSGR